MAAHKDAQRSEGWHTVRKGKVTGSKVAAVLGLSPFGGPADAARTLLGLDTFKGNVHTEWGTNMEARAIAAYKRLADVKVEETTFWPLEPANMPLLGAKPRYDKCICGGSPDGLVADYNDTSPSQSSSRKGVLEVKCPGTKAMPVPIAKCLHHMAQLQFAMICTNRGFGDFVSFTPMALSAERIPAAGTVPLHTVEVSQAAKDRWAQLGVYDPKTQKWPGYKRVFVQVLENFYAAVMEAKERGSSVKWDHWKFTNFESTRLIKAVHMALVREAKVRLLVHHDFASFPLARGQLPRKISWPSVVLWQMGLICAGKYDRSHCRFGRFAVVETPSLQVKHMMDIAPRAAAPHWFALSGVVVDVLHGDKLRKTKKLSVIQPDGTAHDVPYFRFERRPWRLPAKGIAVTTEFDRGNIVSYGVAPWTTAVTDTNLAEVHIELTDTLTLHLDVMHRFVRMTRQTRAAGCLDDVAME